MRTFRLLLLVLAALAALAVGALAAGCGGDADSTEEAFEQEVVAARDRTDSALAQITTPTSEDDLLVRIRLARDEVASASGELAVVEAPEDLRDEQRALAGALSALSTELDGTANTLETLGPGVAGVRTLDFETWDRVQRALETLREAGVEVEPLRRHGGEGGS
ncbi:MAG TPA: hypothetical protein VNT23_05135 [Gaiellaceae bacterium]|nr:hypothetical protein [Gaiellaceae bacterium]